ncbi:MAG TPA: hypothetical protein VE913_25030 [Longimicrobium sp.]|nr:hypothetical protein [Longimicrobium sp.]
MKARCLLLVLSVAVLGACGNTVTAPAEPPPASRNELPPPPPPVPTDTTLRGGGSMGNGN